MTQKSDFAPILVISVALLLLWYVAAVPMNAVVAQSKIEAAGGGLFNTLAISWNFERPVMPAPHQILAEIWNTVFLIAPWKVKSLLFHCGITLSSTLLGSGQMPWENSAALRICRFKGSTELLCQSRIVGLPHLLSGVQSAEIDIPAIKREVNHAGIDGFTDGRPSLKHLKNATALFIIVRSIAVEHDAVARLNCIFQLHSHAIEMYGFNASQQYAAFRGTRCRNEHFVIAPLKPAR